MYFLLNLNVLEIMLEHAWSSTPRYYYSKHRGLIWVHHLQRLTGIPYLASWLVGLQ